MAVAPLNLTPRLQAWHVAGLNCLLLDLPVREFLLAADQAAAQRAVPDQANLPPENLSSRPASVSGAPSPDRTGAGAGKVPPGSETDGVGKEPADNLAAAPGKEQEAMAAPLRPGVSVHELPEQWKLVLQKVGPAPIAWIYPELGQDLLLSADAERGRALRGIIAGLQLKKGSSTFWPASVPGACGAEGGLFRFGLEHLGVKFLVAFGAQALDGTEYGGLPLRPFSEQIAGGRLILALPGFEEILSGQAKLESIIVFLRAVFSRYFL